MPRTVKKDWFSQQKNERIRSISWYWFVEPENPTSLSAKMYPKDAYKKYGYKGKPKGYVNYRVSKYTKKTNDDEFGIATKKYFIILPAQKNINDYNLKPRQLNINFLFDYLEKEKGLGLNENEKNLLKEIFDDKRIRRFLFDWNKKENNLSYKTREIDIKSYSFDKDLVDAILTFFRMIFYYDSTISFPLIWLFDKRLGKEYFKIIDLVERYTEPFNSEKVKERYNLFVRIDNLFEYDPLPKRSNPVWINITPTDKMEKEIIKFIDMTS